MAAWCDGRESLEESSSHPKTPECHKEAVTWDHASQKGLKGSKERKPGYLKGSSGPDNETVSVWCVCPVDPGCTHTSDQGPLPVEAMTLWKPNPEFSCLPGVRTREKHPKLTKA